MTDSMTRTPPVHPYAHGVPYNPVVGPSGPGGPTPPWGPGPGGANLPGPSGPRRGRRFAAVAAGALVLVLGGGVAGGVIGAHTD